MCEKNRKNLSEQFDNFSRLIVWAGMLCSIILIVTMFLNLAVTPGEAVGKKQQGDSYSIHFSKIVFEFYRSLYELLPIFLVIFAGTALFGGIKYLSPGNVGGLLITIIYPSLVIMFAMMLKRQPSISKVLISSQIDNSIAIISGLLSIASFFLLNMNLPDIFTDSKKDSIRHLLYLLELKDTPQLGDFQEIARIKAKSINSSLVFAFMIANVILMMFLVSRPIFPLALIFVITGYILLSTVWGWEKLKLAFLCFISPDNGIDLYRILILNARRNATDLQKEHDQEIIDLLNQYDNNKVKAKRTALIKHLLARLSNKRGQWLDEIMEKIEKGQISIKEGFDKIGQLDKDLKQLIKNEVEVYAPQQVLDEVIQSPQNIPEPTLEENIRNLTGLTDAEIEQAVNNSLIDRDQKHLWKKQNMEQINLALNDYDRGAFEQIYEFICFPNSFTYPASTGRYIIDRFKEARDDVVESNNEPFKPLKGASFLIVFNFNTIQKQYTAVFMSVSKLSQLRRLAQRENQRQLEGLILLLGIFER